MNTRMDENKMSILDERGFPEGWIEQLRPLLGDTLPDFLRAVKAGAPLRGIRVRRGAIVRTGTTQ